MPTTDAFLATRRVGAHPRVAKASAHYREGVARKPRLVGMNHVALEVGDLDAALDFYDRVFELSLRSRIPGMAFVEIGDQFLALSEGRSQPRDDSRHFGLVVDDKDAARAALEAAGAEILPDRFLDFIDPWGNHVQIVDYRDIQFAKTPEMLEAMGLADVEKTPEAKQEIREKLDALREDTH
jgi:lactoylglutathione lyase